MPLSLHHTLITKSHHWSSSSWIYGRLNQLNAITELDICCMRALCHEPRRGKEEWAALFDKDEQGKDRNRKIDNRCRTLQSFGVMGSFFPLWWERRGWVSLRAWDHLRAARWCGLCEQQWERCKGRTAEPVHLPLHLSPVLSHLQQPLLSDQFYLLVPLFSAIHFPSSPIFPRNGRIWPNYTTLYKINNSKSFCFCFCFLKILTYKAL